MSVHVVSAGRLVFAGCALALALFWFAYMCLTDEPPRGTSWGRQAITRRIKNLVPGAGFDTPLPVTTATCPSAIATPKVDSPAPEHTPPAGIPPGGLDASCSYRDWPPLASMLSDDTLWRAIQAVT